jgi:hypothetical protein
LDFFGPYGFPVVLIPHWNNHDGGEELDTSRCFMGKSRFAELLQFLPADLTVIGIDEKTALVMDLQTSLCRVVGLGSVTIIHTRHTVPPAGLDLRSKGWNEETEQGSGQINIYRNGQKFSLECYCPVESRHVVNNIPLAAWKQALRVQECLAAERSVANSRSEPVFEAIPAEVNQLVEARQQARAIKDWVAADKLRNQIAAVGWIVVDTPEGPQLARG